MNAKVTSRSSPPRAARNRDRLPADAAEVSPTTIRVLVADDHAVVREGLAAMIRDRPGMRVVADAADGLQAVELWKRHRPDVTLLDLRMPGLDGVGALQSIRKLDASARVILLTTFDSEEDVYRGMREGAKAYLLKESPCEEILACICRVHAGETCIPPAIAAKLAERIGGVELTGRELEVLELLARGRSNKEIGQSLYIGETTVKSHVKGLFAKLRVLSRTEAVTVATRRGLVRL
jgi:two-component system NarL family response regulator